MNRLHTTAGLALALFAFACMTTPSSHAEERHGAPGKPLMAALVPDVRTLPVEQAINRVRKMGLQPDVVTVAEGTPGRVIDQNPIGGKRAKPGEHVTLLVGVRPFITTLVPQAVGMPIDEALDRLEGAYAVEVREVDAPRDAQPGSVVAQKPRAGKRHPFRGRLRLDVARAPLIVPRVIGRMLDVARRDLSALGLKVRVDRVAQPGVPRGLVMGQEPRSGAEVIPGAIVRLTVVGGGTDDMGQPLDPNGNNQHPHHDDHEHAPPPGAERTWVPRIDGLEYAEAEDRILAMGLVPHARFVEAPGAAPWRVIDQQEQPAQEIAMGQHVHYTVARPSRWQAVLPVPHLLGLTQAEARRVLQEMGFRSRIRQVPSHLGAGKVVGMLPPSGSPASLGSHIVLSIAAAPQHTPPTLQAMPDVRGKRLMKARRQLFKLGLDVRVMSIRAPEAHPRKVLQQAPAPGRRLRPGQEVVIYMPMTVRVPDLSGMRRRDLPDAVAKLDLSLQLVTSRDSARGPLVAVAQEPAAGELVTRGSHIRVQLERPATQGVPVPDFAGQTRAKAQIAATELGLRLRFEGPPMGLGRTEVTAQSVAAGQRVARGSEITLGFRWVADTPPANQGIAVPDVKRLRRAQAVQRLEEAGLRARVRGLDISMGRVSSRVTKQDPAPGSRVARGSVVTITLGW